MEELKQIFELEPENLKIFLLGFLGFGASILSELRKSRRRKKIVSYYIVEFIYTILAISLTVAICMNFEISESLTKVFGIIMGLVGSSLIRKIKNEKNSIADDIFNTVKDKLKK